jgi:hypothetical protein
MRMKIRDDRQMRALTGVTESQFEILLDAFTQTYSKIQWQTYQKGLAEGSRKRHPGGGRKGALPTMRDKLLFLLYYFKVYPTFDVLGTQFDMSRSKANENLHKLVPFLYQTLVHLEVMPYREFATPGELLEALDGIDTILVDVTEREHRRPQDEQTQREHYSGKKTTYDQKHSHVHPQ